jgi:Secretion system C-terminal sorting domain
MKVFCLAIVFSFPVLGCTQTFSLRYDTFDWSVQNEGVNIEATSFGYLLVGGTVNPDMLEVNYEAISIDNTGILLAALTWGTDSIWDLLGGPNSMNKTFDGGMIECGTSSLDGNANCAIRRMNDLGELLWLYEHDEDSLYYGYAAAQGNDSCFYAVGSTNDVSQWYNNTAFLIKVNQLGEFQWVRKYTSGNYRSYGRSIIPTHDGGFLLGCITEEYDDDQDHDFLIIKTDSLGNEEWRRKWGGAIYSSGPAYVNMVSDSNYVMCSALEDGMGSTNQSMRAYAAKVDTTGDIVWEHQYGPYSYPILLTKIEECTDGTFIAAGMKQEQFNYHGLLLKLSSEGDSLWYRTYTYADEELDIDCILRDVIQTTDGGYIACGYTDAITEEESRDTWVLKVDEWGCLVPGCQVGILEKEQTVNFLTYPNPANDVLNIYLESLHHPDGVFNLVDINGKCVKKFKAADNRMTYMLDVSSLAGGMYFLQYLGENGSVLSKRIEIIR